MDCGRGYLGSFSVSFEGATTKQGRHSSTFGGRKVHLQTKSWLRLCAAVSEYLSSELSNCDVGGLRRKLVV